MRIPTYTRTQMYNGLETFRLEEASPYLSNGPGNGDPQRLQRTEGEVGETAAAYVSTIER